MASSIRNSQSLILHEAVPFLDAAERDVDLELQEFQHHNGSQDDDHHDVFSDSDQSASLSAPRQPESILPKILSHISLWGKRRSSRRPGYVLDTRRRRILRILWRTLVAVIMLLGIVQLGTLVLGVTTAFFPEKLDHAFRTWRSQDNLERLSGWPTEYTADIIPVACHSHNDYWRRVPLKSAIKAGCTGVEADVWLFGDDLYVGHAESALTANRTMTSLYIDPLVEILERQNPLTEFQTSPTIPRNGVFDTDPSQTLILLVDFKTNYQELWPVVSKQLDPLRTRNYLTHFNGSAVVQGPITVVVTGNAPFDYVVSDMNYRDMFFDAPLDKLAALSRSQPSLTYDPSIEREYLASVAQSPDQTAEDQNQGQGHSGHTPTNPAIFTRANSYYASVDFHTSIGWPKPYLSQAQRDKIAEQVAGAHAQGLKVRYWGVPNWPIGLRNYLWRELVKLDIDYLNVDDLHAATRGDWRSGHSIWDWSLWGGRDW